MYIRVCKIFYRFGALCCLFLWDYILSTVQHLYSYTQHCVSHHRTAVWVGFSAAVCTSYNPTSRHPNYPFNLTWHNLWLDMTCFETWTKWIKSHVCMSPLVISYWSSRLWTGLMFDTQSVLKNSMRREFGWHGDSFLVSFLWYCFFVYLHSQH